MGIITESAKKKMAGKQPSDRVQLTLHLTGLNLLPDDIDVLVDKLGGALGVQTAFVATVEVPVGHVQAVADLPSVLDVR